jgi:very-short-patch-repair endonuclease
MMINKLKMLNESELELQFYEQLELAGFLGPGGLGEGVEWQKKVDGHKVDFCWPHLKLIVEIQGGTEGFGRGRGAHVREPQYSKDRSFSNEHQMDGWLVLEFTSRLLNSGVAFHRTQLALEKRRA